MLENQKSTVIELPLQITLTNQGEYYFNQNKSALNTLKNRYTHNHSRLYLASYSMRGLQWILNKDYISQIEIIRTDFNSKRGEIMELAKLISYDILQKEYSIKLAKTFKNTPFITQWNHRNPTKILSLKTMLIKSSPSQQSPAVGEYHQKMMRTIIRGAFNHFKKEKKELPGEDVNLLQNKAENYLEKFNPLLWYLVAMNINNHAFMPTIHMIYKILWEYLQKTNIADYLSLLILELASMTENALMQKAVTTYLNGKVDMEHFMRNTKDRVKILDCLEANNEKASLLWRLQGRTPSITESRPFHFLVSNHSTEAKSIIASLEENRFLDIADKSLVDFYESQGSRGQDLGSYYLNYLREECHKQGTLLHSTVSKNNGQGLSLVSLSIRF